MVGNTVSTGVEASSKLQIKVDWLSFTLAPQNDVDVHNNKFSLLHYLGISPLEFEKISGRFFYNSGISLSRMINIYFDDPSKEISKYSAGNVLYVFTGQGSTLLLQKLKEKYDLDWEKSWLKFFKYLQELQAKVTRIDLAVDCFHHELNLDKIERKLKRSEYRSTKRLYNVIKQLDTQGNVKAHTIYVGQSRGKTSSKIGGSFIRFYDKRAESLGKAVVMPREVEDVLTGGGSHFWVRAEQQFNKAKAQACVEEILNRTSFAEVYTGTLRKTIEFLKPSRKNKDKKTWSIDPDWEKFLRNAEKITLSNPERDLTLGRLLRWIRIAVVPSLKLLQQLGDERGFNIYDLIQACEIDDFQKKQKRLLRDAKAMPKDLLDFYLKEFVEGYGSKHE